MAAVLPGSVRHGDREAPDAAKKETGRERDETDEKGV